MKSYEVHDYVINLSLETIQDDTSEIGICCFCLEECNPFSQTCASCIGN